MVLLVLRIVLTGAFFYFLKLAASEASTNLEQDVVNAGRFALAIAMGFAAAVTWAPLFGDTIAGPVTGLMIDGSVSDDNTGWIRWAKRCEARGKRGLTALICFAEGVRRPNLPAAFVLGMRNARPGSWLEKVFAREVWKFNSVVNALEAREVLALRHDEFQSIHPVPEVNLALLANMREPHPEPEILPLPPAPSRAALKRNHRIRLFADADSSTGEDD